MSCGQSSITTTQPIVDCIPQPLAIANTDSIRQQIALDSISTLVVGHWRLVRVESGWSAPKTPNGLAELLIDKEGECVVLMDGNWVSSFRLTLSMQWGRVLFASSEHKGAHYLGFTDSAAKHSTRKRPHLGRIGLCGPYLFVSNNMADGQSHTYERATTIEPNIASLTPIVCRDSLSLHSEVQRVKGKVEYRNDLQAYVIDYALEDLPTTHLVGIVCNWPQAKQYIGKTVAFSGKYFQVPKQTNKTKKQETVYYLRITGFHPVE
jgi:hypothetical protein